MKRILLSIATIALVGAGAAAATNAFFADTETSNGNVFTAGSIDLKVDHTLATYNGQPCPGNCTLTGSELVDNGGFETPVVTDNGGQWQVYPTGIQGWSVVSGAGLEIQRGGVAGNPHSGQQLVEMDSDNPSTIRQTISTVPGQKYRLSFWYSPRPNVPSGDNAVGVTVTVVSNNTTLVSQTVGSGDAGGSQTTWTLKTFEFIAQSATTDVTFSDQGNNPNGYGGYIDDVSVQALSCPQGSYTPGGTCTLFSAQDNPGSFWSFSDVKPGDYGTDLVSLHVDSNDAYACLFTSDVDDNENMLLESESGDTSTSEGELSQYLKLFAWDDDGDGVYETGETVLVPVNTPFGTDVPAAAVAVSTTVNSNVGVAWCMGTQSLSGTTINCSGAGDQNDAQTDTLTAQMVAYAEQQRNNSAFSCQDVADDYRNSSSGGNP